MAKTIVQTLVFKNTTATDLYELYMDAKKQAIITGGPATISKKEGTAYSINGGYITGRNLQLIKDKAIAQTWRAADWDATESDSIFTIHLEQKGNDVTLLATHANLPDKQADSIDKGWHDYYWKPWKQYLAGKEIKRPGM